MDTKTILLGIALLAAFAAGLHAYGMVIDDLQSLSDSMSTTAKLLPQVVEVPQEKCPCTPKCKCCPCTRAGEIPDTDFGMGDRR